MVGDLPRRVEQERAEDVEDPLEALDERHAGEDEDAAQDERAEDAPEQDPELVLAGHGEEREDHRPHEHVVDRQALLDEEPGVVLAAGLASLPDQQDDAEGEADRDPHRRLDGGFLDGDDVRGAVHEQQVDDEHHDDGADEGEPDPQRDVEAGELAGSAGCGHGAVMMTRPDQYRDGAIGSTYRETRDVPSREPASVWLPLTISS